MKKIGFILALFLLTSFNSYLLKAYFSENPGGGGYCCSASSFLGLSNCTIGSCPAGTCCHCEGGLFTAKCYCADCNLPTPPLRTIPTLTPKQRTDANDFIQWCDNQSENIKQPAPIVTQILSAIDQNNQTQYDYWETQFRNAFINMSAEEQKNLQRLGYCTRVLIKRGVMAKLP
jgi:hypothetical protein